VIEYLKTASKKTVGLKQSLKAVKNGRAEYAFVARDAEERVLAPFIEACREHSVMITYVDTMDALGRACGIEVGAAVACILKS